jgi:hypothetical protein
MRNEDQLRIEWFVRLSVVVDGAEELVACDWPGRCQAIFGIANSGELRNMKTRAGAGGEAENVNFRTSSIGKYRQLSPTFAILEQLFWLWRPKSISEGELRSS